MLDYLETPYHVRLHSLAIGRAALIDVLAHSVSAHKRDGMHVRVVTDSVHRLLLTVNNIQHSCREGGRERGWEGGRETSSTRRETSLTRWASSTSLQDPHTWRYPQPRGPVPLAYRTLIPRDTPASWTSSTSLQDSHTWRYPSLVGQFH